MKPMVLLFLLASLPPCVVDREPIPLRGRADGGVGDADVPATSPSRAPQRERSRDCVFGATLDSLVTTDTRLVNASAIGRDTWLADDGRAQVYELAARLGPKAGSAMHEESLAMALARLRVDHLDRRLVYDVPGARSFVVLTTPAPGVRGLVFSEHTTDVLARVDGAALSHCPARPMRCRLDSTYADFLDDPRFRTLEERRVTRLDVLDRRTEARLLAAAKVADPAVTSLAEAFAVADGGEIHVVTRRTSRPARRFAAVDFGAGDNTYGAIFEHGSDPVVEIHDGDHYACSVLEPL